MDKPEACVCKSFKIRFDADKPPHPATINMYRMISDLNDIEIDCNPLYNCTKSKNEFLQKEGFLPNQIWPFTFPILVYTEVDGVTKKVKCGEEQILKELLKGTKLAVGDYQLKWLEFSKKVRKLMEELSEDSFEDIPVKGKPQQLIFVDHEHKKELDRILDKIENHFVEKESKFLTGSRVAIADIALVCELFPTFAQLEKPARELRNHPNIICWLKRLNDIYTIPYVLQRPVDLYPDQDFTPNKLMRPMQQQRN